MTRGMKIFWICLLAFTFKMSAFSQEEATGDIGLERLIDAALSTNQGIKDGFTKTEISKTEISLSKSALLPRISTDATYTLSNQNSAGNDYGSVSTGVSLNQTLWQNGKNKALIEQSEFLYKAKQSELEAQKQELILQVKFSYFNLLRYKELCKISKNNVEQAELFLEAAKEKNKLGVGKYSDILKAESELADAKYLLKEYNYSLKDAENELERLTGITILADLIESSRINNATTDYEVLNRERLWKIAKKNYPELKSLENIQQSQNCFIKAVKSNFYPNLSAQAGYNWYYNPIFKSQDVWNAGITIRWDLFDGNRRKNQIKIEQLQNQSYQFQKEDLLAELKKEIANRLNALYEAQDQISISKVLIKSTSENLRMLEEEYRQGISSMLELTNARTDNYNAKAKQINAITTYEQARAQLERMIGVINIKTK
jgi:outer membrane protein TolC